MKYSLKERNLFYLIGVLLIIAAVILLIPLSFVNREEEKSTEDHYKKILTPEQYHVLREGGTDIPFSHPEMLHEKRAGTYVTADCNEPVFRSEDKFDSGTGWPSFTRPIKDDAVTLKTDSSLGMTRIEVLSKKCSGHLGHVFDDGPTVLPDGRKATGKRYCINASALKFIPDK